MADEQVLTQEAPAATADAGTVGQSDYINDAFDDYFKGPEERDAEREKTEKQPAAKTEEKPKAPIKAEPPKAAELNAETKQPTEEEKPNPIDAAFAGEDGQLDASKFLEYSVPDFGVDAPIQPAQQTNQQPGLTQAQQKVEERKQYEGQLRGTVDQIYNSIAEKLRAQGIDTSQIEAERQGYHKSIDAHLAERDQLAQQELLESIEKRALERETAAAVSQRALINTNEVIASLPGANTAAKTAFFNEVMFSKNGAQELLNRDFRIKHPEIDKLPEPDRAKLAQKFLNEISANKSELAHYFKAGYNNIKAAKIPALLQNARLAQSAMEKSNALSAQKSPGGTLNRPRQSPAADPWESYLTSHHKYADRV